METLSAKYKIDNDGIFKLRYRDVSQLPRLLCSTARACKEERSRDNGNNTSGPPLGTSKSLGAFLKHFQLMPK